MKKKIYETVEYRKLAALISDVKLKGGKFSAVASTSAMDRDDEVVLPKGCQAENFLKNPVMLDIHDHYSHSIGKVTSLSIAEAITFDFEFAETPAGLELTYLYENAFQKAFSIGFFPKEYVLVDESTPQTFDVEVADGSMFRVDLGVYAKRPRAIITKWELLEISPCPVPANPEALLIAGKVSQIKSIENPVLRKIAEAEFVEKVREMTSIISKFVSTDALVKAFVAPHSTPVDFDVDWKKDEAKAQVVRFASSDGSGSKETLDWAKFLKAFAWFDETKPDQLSSYKFLHHTFVDSKFVAVKKGLASCMKRLLSGKEDLKGEDHQVYDHLARHYFDAGMEVPEFTKGLSDDVLDKIGDGTWVAKESEPPLTEPFKKEEPNVDSFTESVGKVLEATEMLNIRMSILSQESRETRSYIEDHLKKREASLEIPDSDELKLMENLGNLTKDLQGFFQTC